ncbi:CASP-like protein 1C1 [Medicago truncatula]|uniref:CASP-like protein 1C1 n=1 Tax=Medicago truncatula TaxID=3880 RepID=UPI0019689E3D|nr:CASP-like protein 1C1 [Medicago truncatula]
MADGSGVWSRALKLVASGLAITGATLMLTSRQKGYYRDSYVHVEFNDMPAYWCFIIANLVLAGFTLLLVFLNCLPEKSKLWQVAVGVDFVLTVFLAASCSAALAVATMECNGNPHAPLCSKSIFGVYCTRVFLACGISLAGSLFYISQLLWCILKAFNSD